MGTICGYVDNIKSSTIQSTANITTYSPLIYNLISGFGQSFQEFKKLSQAEGIHLLHLLLINKIRT